MRIVIDEFNSQIFQKKIGNFLDIQNNISSQELERFISIANSQQYDFLFAKVNTNFLNATNIFLNANFILVDTQITYTLDCQVNNTIDSTNGLFRKFKQSDIQDIAKIAKTSFFSDQFHLDKKLDDQLCDKYYEQWAINSCNGFADDVFVLAKEKVMGFITVHYHGDNATIGLAAISPEFQGKGLFYLLIKETICALHNKRKKVLYYGTQIGNIPVHKTLAKFKGVLTSSVYVLHSCVI